MIQDEMRPILDIVRRNMLEMFPLDLSFSSLGLIPDFPIEILKKHANNPDELVGLLLEYELEKFASIVEQNDFLDKNAIDAMLVVSLGISKKFHEIFPSVSPQLKILYPKVYHTQFEKRIQFISEKIKLNLSIGIGQGMYRSDLSSELIARLYLSRLIDIHNPEFFPPETFSFEVLFNQMFESLIRSVATVEGLAYFEQRKKHYQF